MARQIFRTKTVRFRLITLIVVGLILTTAAWGWIQLRALDGILVDQQLKRLYDVAVTVNTYYQYFPTTQGLTALDLALREQVQSDGRLARIDIFSLTPSYVDYVAGAGRVSFEWSEKEVRSVGISRKPRHLKLSTEAGPALGLLYTSGWGEKPGRLVVVGAIVFSRMTTDSSGDMFSKRRGSSKLCMTASTNGIALPPIVIVSDSAR